jgi:arabinogalactan oligomer/maltooligosaccharide transport system substrate-binding protein
LISDVNGLFSGELLARFSPPALEQGQYKSAQLGLPNSLQGVVIYRNRSIIPESADTFDDLLSLAASFTEGDTIGAVLERGFFYSGGHLDGIGGSLLGDDGLPEFNDVKGIEWVNLLQDFELSGATTYLSDRDLELFREGRVGIVIDGTWNLNDLAEAVGEQDLVIDPWPTYGDDALSGYVQSEHVFLNPNISDHNLDATLLFVEYFSSPEAQTILAGVGFIPAVTDLQLTGEASQRHLTQAMIALAGGSGYPVVPEMSIYPAYMDQALRSIFELGAVPQDALNAAEEAILQEIEQMQETQETQPQDGG